MSDSGWPELPDQWTPITPTDDKPREKRRPRRRQSEGREQEAKEVKGDGQWASMGELLM